MICPPGMADGFNEDASSSPRSRRVPVHSLVNHQLKLPPISSGVSLVGSRTSSLQKHCDDSLFQRNDNLPLLHLRSLGERLNRTPHASETTNAGKTPDSAIDNSSFSLPRVYSVLPPIGMSLVPSPPHSSRKNELDDSVILRQRNRDHFPKAKRHEDSANTATSRTSVTARETLAKTQNEPLVVTERSVDVEIREASEPNETVNVHVLETESRATAPRDVVENISEQSSELMRLKNVPEDLRLYADVYPVSPPRNEKRARNVASKKRHELRKDNDIRLEFMEGKSSKKRNATCAELDDVLKNAVQCLREVFLRKTMEELCMMW